MNLSQPITLLKHFAASVAIAGAGAACAAAPDANEPRLPQAVSAKVYNVKATAAMLSLASDIKLPSSVKAAKIRQHIKNNADVNADDCEALIMAISDGEGELVQMLLDAGANPDARQGEPLIKATLRGDMPIVRALLKANANPHATDRAATQSLLTNKASSDLLLLVAAMHGHFDLVELYVTVYKFDPDGSDKSGNIMAELQQTLRDDMPPNDIIRYTMTNAQLIRLGADKNIANSYPLIVASTAAGSNVGMQMLIDAGVDVDGNKTGLPLATAIKAGRPEAVDLLLKNKADPTLPTVSVELATISGDSAATPGQIAAIALIKKAIAANKAAVEVSTTVPAVLKPEFETAVGNKQPGIKFTDEQKRKFFSLVPK